MYQRGKFPRQHGSVGHFVSGAGHTVSQLFTVPHDKKRKREEAQQQDGTSEAAAAEQPGPVSEFPISHYVLSYKVGGAPSLRQPVAATCRH